MAKFLKSFLNNLIRVGSIVLFIYLFYCTRDFKTSLKISLWVFFGFTVGIKFIGWIYKQVQFTKTDIKKIDQMSGAQFEEYLGIIFKRAGYSVDLTPISNDYGADLIIKKSGMKTAVQAKRYRTPVGNKAVQEVVAAKAYYNADHAMVVTNSTYTRQAIELAKVNGVELWDRKDLKKYVAKIKKIKENKDV